ncbi:MAG: AAA family ATPase [Chloroflexota bacterium]
MPSTSPPLVKRPFVVAFSGPPCSGKSTLAALLGRGLSAPHLGVDALRVALLPDAENRPEHRRTAHRAMHLCAGLLLQAGKSVVLDATYHPFSERLALEKVVQAANAALYVIECRVAADLAAARVLKRRSADGESDLTPAQVREYVQDYHYSEAAFPVDTQHDPEANLELILRHIRNEAPTPLGAWSNQHMGPASELLLNVTPLRGDASVRASRVNPVENRTDQSLDDPDLTDRRPCDPDVYAAYVERSTRQADGFLISDVPVYFLVPPMSGRRFNAQVSRLGTALDISAVVDRCARVGLDFESIQERRWQAALKHGGAHNERLLRHCALHWSSADRLEILGAESSFREYLATEGAVNFRSFDGAIDLRGVLEGERWAAGAVHLHDIGYTSRHFASAVSVAVLVTTNDGYLALQRRSSQVIHGAGHFATTASGFVSWDRDVVPDLPDCQKSPPTPHALADLWTAVLRELWEEVGLTESDLLYEARPFLAAGYNLLHGRDLNFYAAVRTKLGRSDLLERTRSATDGWEHSELRFVPVTELGASGLFTGAEAELMPQCNRHLRAALLALAITDHGQATNSA